MSEIVVSRIIGGVNSDTANAQFSSIENAIAVGYQQANTMNSAANSGTLYQKQTSWLPSGLFLPKDVYTTQYLEVYTDSFNRFGFVAYDIQADSDLSFDTVVHMPRTWDGGNVDIKILWNHWTYARAGSTGNTVYWGAQAARVAAFGNMAVNWDNIPKINVASVGEDSNGFYIAKFSDSVNVGGDAYNRGNTVLLIRITRWGTSPLDTLSNRANFHGISLEYNTDRVII